MPKCSLKNLRIQQTMSDLFFCLLAVFCGIVIVFLLNFFIRWKAYGKNEHEIKKAKLAAEKKRAAAKASGLLVTCPLCNSPLLPGQDLFSRVYRPMTVSDQLCTISGCPHCYPVVEPGLKRECPVCHKEVPLGDGHLVARLFNKTDGKKHVVVSGCGNCCRSR